MDQETSNSLTNSLVYNLHFRSDEHDCPCDMEDNQTGDFLPFLPSHLILKSGINCLKNTSCFKIKNIKIDLDKLDYSFDWYKMLKFFF